jgi:hypothetical protein
MKYTILGILFSLSIVLLCCNSEKRDNISKTKSINHGLSKNSSNSPLPFSKASYGEIESGAEQKAKIPIGKNEKLLEVINANLDLDEAEEQILILKDTNDAVSPLKISVIDYDEARNIYFKSWEGATNATNPRIFEVELLDVIGDFGHEIVFHGMNARDLTLDIFKRTPSPSNPGLHFQPVCQIVSNGTIRIQKADRSSAYEIGQKAGDSYPVLVERKDATATNDLNLIEETYNWVSRTNRYELISTRSIPSDVASQAKLATLFSTNDENTFLDFLKGPWFQKKQTDKLVAFYPEENQFVFSLGNVQEVYSWDYSKRTLYNGFMIVAHNILINSIKMNMNITAHSPNSIEIFVEDDTWAGEYQKLNDSLQEQFYKTIKKSIKPSALELHGVFEDEYKGDKTGNQIIFEPPFFTWLDKNKSSYGGYSVIENMPITNPNYYKTKLQFLPDEVDNNTFTNGVRKKITLNTDDQLLSKYYTFDRARNSFILNDNISKNDIQRIWELFVSVQYKGYMNYKFGIITFKVLKENGLVERVDNFIIEYIEKKDTDKIVKTLILTPGKLNVNGIEVLSTDSIRLVQTNLQNPQ